MSLLFGLSAALLSVANVEGLADMPDKITGLWFANWAQYRGEPYDFTPSDLGDVVDDIDILFYGFAYFCPNSSMVQPYWVTELNYCDGLDAFSVIPIDPNDEGYYSEITAMQSNSDFKFVLSIGGWNFPSNFFSGMVATETSRQAFITSLITYLNQYSFDGVDFDWEYPGSAARDDEVEISCTEFQDVTDDGGTPNNPATDGDNFVLLLKELREAFDKDSSLSDGLITFCGQAGLMHIRNGGFPLTQLTKYADFINIMTYDFTVSDTSSQTESLYTAPNEPLWAPASAQNPISQWNVNYTVNGYLELGAPADQLLVGIAYYGHSWQVPLTNGSDYAHYGLESYLGAGGCCGPTADTYGGMPGQYIYQCGSYAYFEIQQAACPTTFDNETATYIMYCADASSDGYTKAGTWINYQGPDTIRAIVNFANENKLRGAFGFDVTLDSYDNGWTFDLTKLLNTCVKESSC